MNNYYAYKELLAEAQRTNDYSKVADWLDKYDVASWNGESYDLENGNRLYPIYNSDDEITAWEER